MAYSNPLIYNLGILKMNELKTVFITGASKGLGKVLCERFSTSGYNVFATAREIPDNFEESKNVSWAKLDITNYTECERVINLCIKKYGSIDILINNASSCEGGVTIADLSVEQIEKEINTSYKGAVFLSQLFVNENRNKNKGKIFFISSSSALKGESGNAYYSLYAGNKAALVRFSECLNEDVSQFGMQSSVIIPCNMRDRDRNLIEENAISYNDMANLLLSMTTANDNLSLSEVILRPANQRKQGIVN